MQAKASHLYGKATGNSLVGLKIGWGRASGNHQGRVGLFCPRQNEALIHVTAWMYFENIELNERSQTPKAMFCMILFTWNIQNRHRSP